MPNDLPPAVTFAILSVMGLILLVGPTVWYLVFRQLSRGEPILEHEPRRAAPWGLVDFVIFIAAWFGSTVVVVGIASALFGVRVSSGTSSPAEDLHEIFLGSLSQLLAAFLTGAIILLRTNGSLSDLGISFADLGRDIRLGAAAFCALAIPTYGLQFVLTQFWESEHPLIESLKASPQPQFLAIALFAAVVSAPLTEEFLFRVLLQGWLEKIFDPERLSRDRLMASILVGHREGNPIQSNDALPQQEAPLLAELADPRESLPAYQPDSVNPYLAPIAPAAITDLHAEAESPTMRRRLADVLAIATSSIIFAGLHYSHGPDWIPLLFLALGLGYLYRRTHRITPGLVVHFLLNAVSMLGFWAQMYEEKSLSR